MTSLLTVSSSKQTQTVSRHENCWKHWKSMLPDQTGKIEKPIYVSFIKPDILNNTCIYRLIRKEKESLTNRDRYIENERHNQAIETKTIQRKRQRNRHRGSEGDRETGRQGRAHVDREIETKRQILRN